MCGRFACDLGWDRICAALAVDDRPPASDEPALSFNVAPTHACSIVRSADGRRILRVARWGFVPSWWTRPEPPRHAINARSETVATSGLFRGAFRAGRCVAPALGFYEWRTLADGSRWPVFIHRADGAPTLLAGLSAQGPSGETFAILTTTAAPGLEDVHDRSPVILEPEQVRAWLDPATPEAAALALCVPAAAGVLAWHSVGRAVGNVRAGGPGLIEPVQVE